MKTDLRRPCTPSGAPAPAVLAHALTNALDPRPSAGRNPWSGPDRVGGLGRRHLRRAAVGPDLAPGPAAQLGGAAGGDGAEPDRPAAPARGRGTPGQLREAVRRRRFRAV